MARQKTLNKNLVAFVTVMGMLLIISVVALATRQQTRRDPEIFATSARQFESAQDFERAIERYLRAFEASKRRNEVDVKYLVDASRCAYRIGMIGEAMQYLAAAHTQQPDDASVLEAQLERFWELSFYPIGVNLWPTIREAATELLKLNENHTFALVALSEALRVMQTADPAYERQSKEAIDKAIQLDPNNPRVAMIVARRSLSRIVELRQQIAQGRAPADVAQQIQTEQEKAIATLEASLQANPDDTKLIVQLAQTFLDSEKPEQAGELVERSVKSRPDDPELLAALGRFRLRGLAEKRATLTVDEQKAMIASAREPLAAAVSIDPALYEIYVDLARLALMDADPNADIQADLARRYSAALDIYEEGMKKTIGLKSLRAELNKISRPIIYYEAFRVALGYSREITDPRQKQIALTRMKRIVDDTAAQYPDLPMTYLLQGEMAMSSGDTRVAQLSYLKAEEKSRDSNRMVYRLACEQLSYLYRDVGELGTALRYAEAAIQANQRDRIESSARLMLTYAQLLLAMDKAQEAYDVAVMLREKYPTDENVVSALAASLGKLGRNAEAERLLQSSAASGGDEARADMIRAKLAFSEGNYEEAMQFSTNVLRENPRQRDVLSMYIACAAQLERQEEARAFLKSLRDALPEDGSRLMYDAFDVVLAEKDENKRAAELRKIVDQMPDELARLRESYNLYIAVNDLENAKGELLKLEKLTGDEPAIIEEKFTLALRLQDIPTATEASARLSRMNADRCNGARYRAQLAMATEKWTDAIRELRTTLTVFPNDSRLRYNLAYCLLKSGTGNDEAIALLRSAIESNPTLLAAYKMLYEVLEQTGRRDEAMIYLARAQKIAPRDEWITSRADLIAEENDPRVGIARRERLRESAPNDLDNLLRLVDLYVRANDIEKAEQAILAAMKLNAGHPEIGRLIVTTYVDASQRDTGERLLREHMIAAQGADRYVAMIRLSRFYEAFGELEAARQTLDTIEKTLTEMIPDAGEQRRYRSDIRIQFAEFFARLRMFPESTDAARRVLDGLKRPEDDAVIAQARVRILDNLFEMQKWGDLEREIDQFIRDFPEDLRGARTQARYLFARRRLEEARMVLNDILGRAPDDAMSLYLRGTINLEQRRFTETRDDLQRARQITQPEAGRPLDDLGLAVRIMLANYFDRSGSFELAEAVLKELLVSNPGNQQAAFRLMNLYRANKRLDAAQKTINEFITLDTKSPFWPFQLGLVMMDREEYSAASIQFRNAAELSQYANPDIVTSYLRALVKGKRAEEAVHVFEALPPEKLTAVIRVTAASCYQAAQRPDDAARLLDKAATEAAHVGLGAIKNVAIAINLLFSAEEASRVLDRVMAALPIESEPGQRARVLRAQLYIDMARTDDGLKLIDDVIQATKEKSVERVGALLTRAEAQYRSGDLQSAIATYREVLAIDADNIDALNNAAYFLAESNQAQEAAPFADRLLTLARGVANVMDTVGWVYFKAGRLDEAERVLRDAVRADIDAPAPVYHLGEVLEAAGRRNEARDMYRDALQTAQKVRDTEYAKKAQDKLDGLK